MCQLRNDSEAYDVDFGRVYQFMLDAQARLINDTQRNSGTQLWTLLSSELLPFDALGFDTQLKTAR
jgi:hypothetical protein